jgi:Fic family protein
MARWHDAVWEPSWETGLPPRDHRHGPYRQYVPDPLRTRPLHVDPDLARRVSTVELAVRGLTTHQGAAGLEGLAPLLLRSEAIASSMIEGLAPSPHQVALAELAQDEQVRGFSDQARLVANNITVLRRAVRDLTAVDEVTVEDVVALHSALLPDERHHGLRQVQNWIGGSSWHPVDAQFVPPPPELVPDLMADLVGYLNGAAHAPLVQAALVHAQFETIHPFTDGNGRLGRALIHTVLTRRGLTPSSILPISLVLATLRDRYVDGLTHYRYEGQASEPSAAEAVGRWIDVFVSAADTASDQAQQFAVDVAALSGTWSARLADSRVRRGLRAAPRREAASTRLLRILVEAPILTSRTAQRLLGVSFSVARAGLEELADAGILTRRSVDRGATGYAATEVFDLLTWTERRMASTRWDTRSSPPNRAVPVAPHARS